MCYKKPGPRCTAHAKEALRRAATAFATDTSSFEAYSDLRLAQDAYDQTPGGMRELERNIATTDDPQKQEALQLRLDEGRDRRAAALALIKMDDQGDIAHATEDTSTPQQGSALQRAVDNHSDPASTIRSYGRKEEEYSTEWHGKVTAIPVVGISQEMTLTAYDLINQVQDICEESLESGIKTGTKFNDVDERGYVKAYSHSLYMHSRKMDETLRTLESLRVKGMKILNALEDKARVVSNVRTTDLTLQSEVQERQSTLEHHVSVIKNSLEAISVSSHNLKIQHNVLTRVNSTLRAADKDFPRIVSSPASVRSYREQLQRAAVALASVDHSEHKRGDRPEHIGRRDYKRALTTWREAKSTPITWSDIDEHSPSYRTYQEEQRHVAKWLSYEKAFDQASSVPWMRDYSNPRVAAVVRAMQRMEVTRTAAAHPTASSVEEDAYLDSVRHFARKLKAAEQTPS